MGAALQRWFLRGARPLPALLSNLHALLLEGWGRRHAAAGVLGTLGLLGLGLLRVEALAPLGLLTGYLLALGLWQQAVRPLSAAAGLKVLVLVPAAAPLLQRLLRRQGLGWSVPGPGPIPLLDLHVDSSRRFGSVEDFYEALDADAQTLASLWIRGALGPEALLLTNTFNRRLLRALEERLGPLGTVRRQRGCLLVAEQAWAHSEREVAQVQRQMFGQVLPGLRARDRAEQWDLLWIHLGPGPTGDAR